MRLWVLTTTDGRYNPEHTVCSDHAIPPWTTDIVRAATDAGVYSTRSGWRVFSGSAAFAELALEGHLYHCVVCGQGLNDADYAVHFGVHYRKEQEVRDAASGSGIQANLFFFDGDGFTSWGEARGQQGNDATTAHAVLKTPHPRRSAAWLLYVLGDLLRPSNSQVSGRGLLLAATPWDNWSMALDPYTGDKNTFLMYSRPASADPNPES